MGKPVKHLQELPRELAIFDAYRRPDCVPQDTLFKDLTPEQKKVCLDAYRFSGFVPGIYQGITGVEWNP